MFTTPLCLEVIAGDEMEDALYETPSIPISQISCVYQEPQEEEQSSEEHYQQ